MIVKLKFISINFNTLKAIKEILKIDSRLHVKNNVLKPCISQTG